MSIKSLVPSEVCLACEGCCRYDLANSPWRPKVGEAEPLRSSADSDGYLPTRPLLHRHACQFFRAEHGTCIKYNQRPFECALYPGVISKEDDMLVCYVHLACPYVQDPANERRVEKYKAYMRDWFQSHSVKAWLSENEGLLHDYRHAKDELELVFKIPAIGKS